MGCLPGLRGHRPGAGAYDCTHADTVTRRWGCENCGASWVAVYTLTWYEGLERPSGKRLTMREAGLERHPAGGRDPSAKGRVPPHA